MILVKYKITVNKNVEDIFDFVKDTNKAIYWQEGLIEKVIDGDFKNGSIVTERFVFMGKEFVVKSKVVEYETNRKIGYKAIHTPYPFEGTYSFDEDKGSTLIKYVAKFEPKGYFSVSEKEIRDIANHTVRSNLKKLRMILENRQYP